MLHISLAGEVLGHLGTFPLTNSLITTWIVMAVLIILGLVVRVNLSLIPGKFQLAMEMVVKALYDMFEGVLGHQVKRFFPLLATFFLFIIVSNWFGLLPGVGSIGLWEAEESSAEEELAVTSYAVNEQQGVVTNELGQEINTAADKHSELSVGTNMGDETIASIPATLGYEENTGHSSEPKLIPLFRAPTADLNTTLGLALISFVTLQFFGFRTLGMAYGKKFINLSNPINFYVGILEIISEFGKIVSFGFRLFGNIFAGEVLLTVIAFLVPIIAPIPFLGLELFVGLIQALVFSMLTAVFLSTATSKEGH